MAIKTFGVLYGDVHSDYYPQQQGGFSTTSRPKATTVSRFISNAAADLAGKLAQEGLSATTLDDGSGTLYPNAYAWCAQTIRLAAAIAVFPSLSGMSSDLLKAWKAELAKRYEDLDKYGNVALGDAPAPTLSGNGPSDHVSAHALDTGDEDDISEAEKWFRRDQVH